MAKVKIHEGCIGQANVALRRTEPPAPKCRCKKMIDFHDADTLVKQGMAKWVVTKRDRGAIEVPCPMCLQMSDVERKTCGKCKGTGKTVENRIWESFNDDIVLLGDDKEGFKQVTPRVATIEVNHIEGAYIYEYPYVLDRIKEYGTMIQWALQDFGAQIKDGETGEEIMPGRPEPRNERKSYPPGTITFKDGTTNKCWWWTAEGRDYDYGRTIS